MTHAWAVCACSLSSEQGLNSGEGSLRGYLKSVGKTAFSVIADMTNVFSFLFSDVVLRASSDI